MKKILLATDFSANARHALIYAYQLAKRVKADMIICNAVIEPAEIPQAGLIVWPMEESEVLLKDGNIQLDLLKRHLDTNHAVSGFTPAISCIEQSGTVVQVVNEIIAKHDIGLVIFAAHGRDGLTTLILGDHSRELIDCANMPLLLVPPVAEIVPVKKIAFATDFEDLPDDLLCINKLITLARPLNAEILIANIFKKDRDEAEQYIKELSNRASYPLLYYRLIKAGNAEAGLNWLCEHGQVDVLAMVHRSQNFMESIFGTSHTQKMAKHINIPLLVFPANSPSKAPIF